jgi:cell division protein FtsB
MAALPQELDPAQLPVPVLPVGPTPVPAPQAPPRRGVRRARRPGRYVAAMFVIAALAVFGSVSLNALAAEQSFAVRELEQQVADLTRRADELTVEVTRLESPARLHRRAVQFVVLPGATSTDSEPTSRTMAAGKNAKDR